MGPIGPYGPKRVILAQKGSKRGLEMPCFNDNPAGTPQKGHFGSFWPLLAPPARGAPFTGGSCGILGPWGTQNDPFWPKMTLFGSNMAIYGQKGLFTPCRTVSYWPHRAKRAKMTLFGPKRGQKGSFGPKGGPQEATTPTTGRGKEGPLGGGGPEWPKGPK